MDPIKKEKIDVYIKSFKGPREILIKNLKAMFGVQLLRPGKYVPHIGLQQRIRNLMKTGLTRDEALARLENL
jgi:hypothetical protein